MKKKILALGTCLLSSAVLGACLISNPVSDVLLFSLLRSANYNNLSVTFDSNSTVIGGSIKSTSCILGSSLSISGLRVKAIINNSSIPMSDGVISRFNNDYATVYFSIDDPSNPSVTRFQNLKSISFGYKAGSTSGNFKVGWSADNSYWNDISVVSGTTTQELPVGAHYLRVVNDSGYAQFTSFTLNYSCSDSPAPDIHNINYYGTDFEDIFELVGIDTSSLVYTAETGSHVVIEPVALLGYEFYSAFEFSEYITDFNLQDGAISFTMPDHDVDIAIAVETLAVELTSISVTGQTTEFTVGDTFEFDGTVTAYYSDGSDVDVTDDADIDEPDMYETGEQTVTVSYSDGNVTKSFEYTVTITSGSSEIILQGTYNYTSRSKHSTPDWSLQNMTITFYNDGTCMWRNVRTNTLGNNFDCKVYFTYVASSNGVNITVAMAHTTYDFTKDGAYNNQASSFSGGAYDRPINGSFGSSTSRNDSIVMALDRSSFTINTYDQSHSYEVYDTFTFTLAN